MFGAVCACASVHVVRVCVCALGNDTSDAAACSELDASARLWVAASCWLPLAVLTVVRVALLDPASHRGAPESGPRILTRKLFTADAGARRNAGCHVTSDSRTERRVSQRALLGLGTGHCACVTGGVPDPENTRLCACVCVRPVCVRVCLVCVCLCVRVCVLRLFVWCVCV